MRLNSTWEKSAALFKHFSLSFAILSLALAAGCGSHDQRAEHQANVPVPSNQSKNESEVRRGKAAEEIIEFNSEKVLQKFSEASGISPINENTRSAEFDFRLLINFGMPGDERMLRINSESGENSASFYEIYSGSEKVNFTKTALSEPRSGWTDLKAHIESTVGPETPLESDPNFTIARHEGMLWLDFVNRGKYIRRYYGTRSEFPDGIRLRKLCEHLSLEFSLEIDCRGERTRLGPIGGR